MVVFSWKHSLVWNIFSLEDGELVDNPFITKLTKVLETLIKLYLFFKQLEKTTVTPLFQFIICSVFLNRPIVDCWPLAVLCFSFPSNFEKKFHLIMWFVVWNVNSASECHVFLWFLVLNWNFKIRCSIYTSKLFFFLPQRKNTYFEHELSESVQGHLFDLGLRIGIKQSCFIP